MNEEKKKKIVKKMVKIKLGDKAKENFGYRISDHKGNTLKQGGMSHSKEWWGKHGGMEKAIKD